MDTDTLPAWLAQRFSRLPKAPWDEMSPDDQSYWEHEAAAVRRAVERGGFKKPEATANGTTTPAALAREILARVEADPEAFAPGLGGFATVCSHAVWPEDDIDGGDTQLGVAGWACHLAGWKLSTDDCNAAWAFEEDWEQRRSPVEVAAELLGLDSTSLLEDPDRDAALAGLRAIAEGGA